MSWSILRRRVVFLGKTDMPAPPTGDDEQKYAINARHVSSYVVCTGEPAGLRRPAGAHAIALPRLHPAPLGSVLFYAAGPLLALRAAARRPPAAIVCQSPFEAFGVALLRGALPSGARPLLQIEVHGDWRTATRLYGGSRRHAARPLRRPGRGVDTAACRPRARVVSEWLGGLVRDAGYEGPMDRFIAYSDYDEFLTVAPVEPPDAPRALFVGVLERYKAVDVLLDAWPLVTERLPDARLTMIGGGTRHDEVVERIKNDGLAHSVELLAPMSRTEVRRHTRREQLSRAAFAFRGSRRG